MKLSLSFIAFLKVTNIFLLIKSGTKGLSHPVDDVGLHGEGHGTRMKENVLAEVVTESDTERETPHTSKGTWGQGYFFFFNSLDQILLLVGKMNKEVKSF